MQLGQQLWTRPVYPHPDDEEFEATKLGSEWYNYSRSGSVYGTFDYGSVDTYDTAFTSGNTVRVNVNGRTRPSWMIAQAPQNRTMYIAKSISLPTNVVIVSRAKFNNYYGGITSATDCNLVLQLCDDDTGDPDFQNRVLMQLNQGQANETRAVYAAQSGGSWLPGVYETSDVDQEGQALEYMAIQKIGTTYHGWVGTASGNWIWMDDYTYTGTIGHIGFQLHTNTNSKPAPIIFGVDFLRFYETDNFPF